MTQRELNRAVAEATGETIQRIERMGFTLVVVPRSGRRGSKSQRRGDDTLPADGNTTCQVNGAVTESR